MILPFFPLMMAILTQEANKGIVKTTEPQHQTDWDSNSGYNLIRYITTEKCPYADCQTSLPGI